MSQPSASQQLHRQDWWRSPAEREALLAWQRGEFTMGSDTGPDGLTRRRFLALAGASLSLAGLAGCMSKPAATIVPYVTQPPELTPGVACFYASSLVLDGYATGVLLETHEGRPTKIEGNPDHPASFGASGVLEQSAILDLYDPHRVEGIRQGLAPRAWAEARAALAQAAEADGAGLHLLLEPSSSPTVAHQLEVLRERLPKAEVHWHTSSGHGAELEATALAFAHPLLAHLETDKVQRGLIIGSDPLASGPWCLRHARGWADGRRRPGKDMSRWYVAESTPTCSGFSADHRLQVEERDLPGFAAAILAAILQTRPDLPLSLHLACDRLPSVDVPASAILTIADDLIQAGISGAVVCGPRAPRILHLLTAAINAAIGSKQVVYRPSQLIGGDRDGLATLGAALQAGVVQHLIVIGANPLFTADTGLDLPAAFAQAAVRIRVGLSIDESAADCDWFIPLAHPLESWGDARAYDGTLSFQQPAIDPLHGGRSLGEILAALVGAEPQEEHRRLRDAWRRQGMDDQAIDRALRRGCVQDSAVPALRPAIDWMAVSSALRDLHPATGASSPPRGDSRVDLSLFFDSKVHDGRFGTNPWLQELPDPVTKLTWDNALLISPTLAQRLGVANGRWVELRGSTQRLRVPVLIQPGQSTGTVGLALGYGRRVASVVAQGVGSDAFPLRSAEHPWLITDVEIVVLAGERALALTQEHWSLEDRPVALDQQLGNPPSPAVMAAAAVQPSLRPASAESSPQWGMVVDLGTCTGCSACVTACQAENNIPVVGRQEVLRSREMHWIRVDRYYRGTTAQPSAINQPMMCQHCEKAPCEYVCPTYATTHSPDGLNEMTYNRCVGTRFCSNNCPYKVRRFNWFNYRAADQPLTRLAMNPDVTVRERGVMEKCTYCVQRIRETDITARLAGRLPGDIPVVTACQQACPTQAIVFGNILDAATPVAHARLSSRAYAVLDDSGAQPRTRYLSHLLNPHPDWP